MLNILDNSTHLNKPMKTEEQINTLQVWCNAVFFVFFVLYEAICERELYAKVLWFEQTENNKNTGF